MLKALDGRDLDACRRRRCCLVVATAASLSRSGLAGTDSGCAACACSWCAGAAAPARPCGAAACDASGRGSRSVPRSVSLTLVGAGAIAGRFGASRRRVGGSARNLARYATRRAGFLADGYRRRHVPGRDGRLSAQQAGSDLQPGAQPLSAGRGRGRAARRPSRRGSRCRRSRGGAEQPRRHDRSPMYFDPGRRAVRPRRRRGSERVGDGPDDPGQRGAGGGPRRNRRARPARAAAPAR